MMGSFGLVGGWERPCLKRQNPALGRVCEYEERDAWWRSARRVSLIVVGVLLQVGGGPGDLPARSAVEGSEEQFIHEARHRLAPVPGFVIEGAHEFAVDAGRVVGSPGHKDEGPNG